MIKAIRGNTFKDLNLELGCGDSDHWKTDKEYVRIDCKDFGQDIVWDLEKGIPLPDNSCKYIYASHIMEHINDFIGLMNECHRVLEKDGELLIIVPSVDHDRAFIPSHVRYFREQTFNFFENPDHANSYGIRLWEIKDLVINERKHIHVRMSPK